MRWNAWFNRVPSESNIADDPSRGVFQYLIDAGVTRADVNPDEQWSQLLLLATRGGTDQQVATQVENDERGQLEENLKKQSGRNVN